MKIKVKEYIEFYKKVLLIVIPITIQNGISNFVGLLDNVMIGQLGTEQMSGVSIVNQLMFIFHLCIFGAISGAGIYTAQYYGQKNHEGVKNTFHFKLMISAIILILAETIFAVFGSDLISMFLHESDSAGDLLSTLLYGKSYMWIMLIGLVPFAIECCYSGTLRECGQTFIPMLASFVAVFVNLIFNYLFIFGKFGFPELGVEGAAVATVISRFVQMLIVIIWTHTHKIEQPFIGLAYKSFKIEGQLLKKFIIISLPLIANESLWSLAVTIANGNYSFRGLDVVAGLNINSTIANVFNIAFFAFGDAVAIIVGQLLGANKLKEAKESAYKIIGFSFVMTVIVGSVLFITAPLFPGVYNTSDEVKALATSFLRISAVCMPIAGFLHPAYFTIRSGGKTVVTFLFDSGFSWVVTVPLSFIFARYTNLNIVTVLFIVGMADLIKVVIGAILLRKGVWINNIVGNKENV